MRFYRGRLFDHVNVKVKDISRSKNFYQPIIECLGFSLTHDQPHTFSIDELTITESPDLSKSVHLAFTADSPAIVKLFHKTGVENGGQCNGGPKERNGQGYYSAYVLDPDGNNIEAVYRSSPMMGINPSVMS